MAERYHANFPFPAHQWEKVILQFNLSRQQIRIVELILLNCGDKQIAAFMGLKVPTVRTYMQRIYFRMGVNDRLALVLKLVTVFLRDPACTMPSVEMTPNKLSS